MNDIYADLVRRLQAMRSPGNTVTQFVDYVKKNPDSVSHLQRVITQEPYVLKCEALDVLWRVNRAIALKEASLFLQSHDENMRRVGLRILGEMPSNSTEAESLILDHIAKENVPQNRYVAVFSLARMGSRRSIPILQEIVRTDNSVDFEGRPISELATRAIKMIKESQEVSSPQGQA